MRRIGRLGAGVWAQWDELRHAAAVIGTVIWVGVQPWSWGRTRRKLFARQIQQRLEKALVKLSDRQRAVFTLRHYDALSLDEIAEILKLDTGTVKAHLFRAITKLRVELTDLYEARPGAGAGKPPEGASRI